MIFNPIMTGGGGGTRPAGPLDPVQVYQDTRPADWLPMPAEGDIQDNELYLLFHIPDGVSSLIAFTATCTGSYTVTLGTMAGGAFTASSSVSVASGSKYEAELLADDYGDLTGDGFKQVMIQVRGTDILTWEPSMHSKKTSPANFSGWNIVEIACRLPKGTSVKCGNSTSNRALRNLRYFCWYGQNEATDMNDMFQNCSSLTAVPQLNTAKVTSMDSMFSNCNSLAAVPQMDTAKVTNMNKMFYGCSSLAAVPQMDAANVDSLCNMFSACYSLAAVPQLNTVRGAYMNGMFQNCSSLTAVPQLNTAKVTRMDSMFSGCRSLAAVPQLNTAKVTRMDSMFSNCYSLATVPQLNTAKVTNMDIMFNNCNSLAAVQLTPTTTGWAGCAISLENCSLGHGAIVDFFNSLPTITAAKAITLTGNPGVGELTEEEKAIATGKGWTLTL